MINQDTAVKIILTIYILASASYLYFVDGRGLADFIYLLFSPCAWTVIKRFSLRNRVIWFTAALTTAALALADSTANEKLRFWCYTDEWRLKAPAGALERAYPSQQLECALDNQLIVAGVTLVTHLFAISVLATIVALIWREKKTSERDSPQGDS